MKNPGTPRLRASPGRVSRRNVPGTYSDANPSDIDVAPGQPSIEREPIERERLPGEPDFEPPVQTRRKPKPAPPPARKRSGTAGSPPPARPRPDAERDPAEKE